MNENEISEKIIGAAIEVHRILGPGLLESVYEEALCHELHLRGLQFTRQQSVPIPYKGIALGTDLRLDLLVENKVIIDLKAKESIVAIDRSKLLTYLRLSDKKLGLIINFHVQQLRFGIERIANNLPEWIILKLCETFAFLAASAFNLNDRTWIDYTYETKGACRKTEKLFKRRGERQGWLSTKTTANLCGGSKASRGLRQTFPAHYTGCCAHSLLR
jgi:GxxExxY protein